MVEDFTTRKKYWDWCSVSSVEGVYAFYLTSYHNHKPHKNYNNLIHLSLFLLCSSSPYFPPFSILWRNGALIDCFPKQ
jgi:hypothetical protein